MSLSPDKREVCARHGWVGRRAFQQDRHDLCTDLEASTIVEETDLEDLDEDPEDDESAELADDADEEEEEEDVLPPTRRSRASLRRAGVPPKKTLAVRRITQLELAAGRAELVALGADAPYDRPRTRAECADVPRPCPYVACKYTLYLDVSETGSIILNFPHLDPWEMPPESSCALDLAERGAMTLEEIAVVTNLTRERIRQVELKALLRRARPAAIEMGLGPEDAAALGQRHQVGPGADLAESGVEGAVPSDVTALVIGGGNDD